ncbi:serine/threonine protein kinase [Paenibacillus sp. J2TS4]|uniref:protein kinase domain-containing protein n=1 Tax=Paenibacillus sp. J2TS4 TaxID=2807194 RepID=UPI001B085ED8|nr:serine/threonine protein kinase [Paenibacillus sp. J2TS4]GIP36350.1 putative serine/threonine-protein kinase YabT [Paenibacillus sp. J2TS4]
MTTSSEIDFAPGARVVGKWRRTPYQVERKLGEGANGKVYLVRRDRRWFALKIGFNTVDLQSEINVLKKLSQAAGDFRHFFVDADDAEINGSVHSFYVMRYVRGEPPDVFLKQSGQEWLDVIGLNLLRKLVNLHRQGFVFGDLKLENVLVSRYGQVELIDFGGVTRLGNGVKQFTEVYDRGYWNGGSRTADECYDLFSFAILCMQLLGSRRSCISPQLIPQNRSVELLLEELEADPAYSGCKMFLHKSLTGQFNSSLEACKDWQTLRITSAVLGSKSPCLPAEAGRWVAYGFAASLLMFGVALYIVWS